MTNAELIKFLNGLTPESDDQFELIVTLVHTIKNWSVTPNNINIELLDYIENENADKFINKPVADAYLDYTLWCEECDYKPVHINVFSRALQQKHNLKVKVVKLNKKATRIYLKKSC